MLSRASPNPMKAATETAKPGDKMRRIMKVEGYAKTTITNQAL